MSRTLVQLLANSVQEYPDNCAVVYKDKRLSYQQLWVLIHSYAQFLLDAGMHKGDRVSVLLENSPEYIAIYYAILLNRGVVVGLNTAAKSRDLINWIDHSQSSLLVADRSHNELEKIESDEKLAGVKIITLDSLDVNFDQSKENIKIFHTSDNFLLENHISDKLASIIYTSGTTGKPKGVMLSHNNLYSNTLSILSYLELNENDSIVNLLPFYYSYGNSVLHTHLASGGKVILENSLMYPGRILEVMEQERVTGLSGVPSTFSLFLSRTNLNDYDLRSIRYITQAGGAMAPSIINKVVNVFKDANFFVMYGQTEATARLCYLPAQKLDDKVGSVGIPVPGVDIQIMDKDNNPVDTGVHGELYARGENIMLGYWRDEEATKHVFHNQWLKTGDIAYKDIDGFIYIVGRSSDMIKSGAHRISPKDIEEVILEISGVIEVAVIGKPDDLMGQVIEAHLVVDSNSDITQQQVLRYCKSNLANYKLPKSVIFRDALPKTASGKIKRFELLVNSGE